MVNEFKKLLYRESNDVRSGDMRKNEKECRFRKIKE